MTFSISWAREVTDPPFIYDEDTGESIVVTAYGNGHICLYWDDQLVAEGENLANWEIPYSDDPDGVEYIVCATALEEGKVMSEPMFYTFYVPAKQHYQTPAPEIYTELTDGALVITAIGEGTVTLYIQYIDNQTGEITTESFVGDGTANAEIARGEEDTYINYWATAQANTEAILGISEVEYYVLIPALDGIDPDPEDPHYHGIWVVTIDKNGDEIWQELLRGEDYYFSNIIGLDYTTYGGYIPGIEPRPQVPLYFVINGITYGAYEPYTEVDHLATTDGCVVSNPLYENDFDNINYYTLPAGCYYSLAVSVSPGYEYSFYAVSAGGTGDDPEGYVNSEEHIGNTYFIADKTLILKGDYQTIRAHIGFKEEFADKVSDVQLIVYLPPYCPLIENSVMAGSYVNDYTLSTYDISRISTVSIPIADMSKEISLCATPGMEGFFNSQAYIRYQLDGGKYVASIGTVLFTVVDASIYVTSVTGEPNITVYGMAAGGKTVKVYDGDVQIAQTDCLANGSWRVTCNLHNPVNPSVHAIHAIVETIDGQEICTESVEVEYRVSVPQVDKISMYNGNRIGNGNVFDFVNGTALPSFYYVEDFIDDNSKEFTFVAKLKGLTASVHNLKFKILDTKYEITSINGQYFPSRNEWICTVFYPSFDKLPITVGVAYDYVWGNVMCHYENDFSDNTNGVTPNVYPCIDPSGFVYEGVPSNRLEGVTTTAYYKDSETGEAVLWDAEQYEQQNPLVTDANGRYRWDVPVGLWQVKYEKEGYETTYSDWLPVPPPQLDVNIGMVQKTQPVVVKAHAYPQAVELEFDKYMYPETLTTDNISVSVNGKAVSGTIELLNAEVDDPNAITTVRRAPGTGLTFASRIRFNADHPFNTDKVKLNVKKDVTTYAGVQMNADYEVVLPLEVEMQTIEADSDVAVPFMGERLLNVAVQPAAAAAGKVLSVRSMAPMIVTTDAENYTLDSNGEAVITVHGDLPGASLLLYSIEGYNLTASTLVNVTMEAETTVATPTASIASDSEVEKGTEVYLYCTTPDATIYYTLDGSSPQDNTDARMVYDGSPIIINSDVTIKAMAVADGMYDSDVATFTYRVKATGLKGDVNLDGNVNIADINLLIDYILRDKVNSETLERGDVNADNAINIADINVVIQIILGAPGAKMPVSTLDMIHMNDLFLSPGEVGMLHVTVDNASRYSALQCDIVLPDGLTLVDVTTTGANVVKASCVDMATPRALTYSMNLLPFAGDSEPVLTLTVRADASFNGMSQVTLTDVVLADAASVAWYAGDCSAMVNNVSAINDVNATGKQVASVRYYNVAGQEMAFPEGMTIQVTTYTDGTRSATRLVK